MSSSLIASADLGMETAIYAKVRRQLLPFLFLLYVVAYLDRINVGFAALQMNRVVWTVPSTWSAIAIARRADRP